jgi:hypothetical protein
MWLCLTPLWVQLWKAFYDGVAAQTSQLHLASDAAAALAQLPVSGRVPSLVPRQNMVRW